jgi:hypothetical protein
MPSVIHSFSRSFKPTLAMIHETTSEYELTELSHVSSTEHFVEINLTPPPSPILPSPAISMSSIATALNQDTICAEGRRTDASQAYEWYGLVFELDQVKNGPLQAGRFLDIKYSDFRNNSTPVLGQILGRWHIQDKDRWILDCELVSDRVKGVHFLVILPRDARLLQPRSTWYNFLHFLFSYFIVPQVTYREVPRV